MGQHAVILDSSRRAARIPHPWFAALPLLALAAASVALDAAPQLPWTVGVAVAAFFLVAGAARAIAHRGLWMMNVHAAGGARMIAAAAAGTAGVWPSVARLSDTVLVMIPANAPKTAFDTVLRSLVAMRAPVRGVIITR